MESPLGLGVCYLINPPNPLKNSSVTKGLLLMKRDMELIKQILKHCERHAPDPRGFLFHPKIPGYSADAVEYHVRLCHDAGYIRTNAGGLILELTWHGHEALEALRIP